MNAFIYTFLATHIELYFVMTWTLRTTFLQHIIMLMGVKMFKMTLNFTVCSIDYSD